MITITHTHADGTLIEGSRRGDGVYELLRGLGANWRWFPSIRQIGLGQSRDKNAQAWKIDSAAEALRAAGFDVAVTIDETERRSFAEAEQERYQRAENRADHHAEVAGSAAAKAEARWRAEHSILDGIPSGQPILVGHHSEGRHRRDLERAESHRLAARAESDRSQYHAGRAEAAGHYQAGRENLGTTLRRIEKLEADERRILRDIAGEPAPGDRSQRYCPSDRRPAAGEYLARLESSLADVREQLAYWREHVAARQDQGVKVWGPSDFRKGDYVRMGRSARWYVVERVNPKSLSVPTGNNLHALTVVTRANVTHAMGPSQWTHKLPYPEVTGRKSAAEMAELVAEIERREAVTA